MNLNIPVPKTPFFVTETATGQQIISREWYRFFTDMGFALGYSTDGVFEQALIAAGPPAETVIAGFVQALAAKILEADDHASLVMGMLEGLPQRIAELEARATPQQPMTLDDILGQAEILLGQPGSSAAGAGAPGSGTVTSVGTGTGLTGGPITTTGTISLASIADQRFLANFSGGAAAPVAVQVIAGTNVTLTPGSNTLTIDASGGGSITSDIATAPQGRLTLTTGVPYLTSDVTGATTIYYTPAVGNSGPIYNGANWDLTTFTEVNQDLSDTTKSPAAVVDDANYDMFIWNDSSTIRCTRGPLWQKTATVTTTVATPCVVSWTTHGLNWGAPVSFTVSGGSLPTGIVSGTTYYVGGSTATVTMTLANPCVVTWTSHGMKAGDTISFSNSGGALPASIVAGTVYYLVADSLTQASAGSTFHVAATPTGSAISTNGQSQSGTHTGYGGQAPAASTFSISAAPGGNFIATTGSSTGTQTAIGGDDSARGTGAGTTELSYLNGILVNKYDVTNGPPANEGTYVGSIRTNLAGTCDIIFGGAGVSGGESTVLGVWNLYNDVDTSLVNYDNIDNWTYTVATWRAKGNSARNAINALIGYQKNMIYAGNQIVTSNSSIGAGRACGINVDAVSSYAGLNSNTGYADERAGAGVSHHAFYQKIAPLGFHRFWPIEASFAVGTTTWYGDNGTNGTFTTLQFNSIFQVHLRA